jgi:hypothetical protein
MALGGKKILWGVLLGGRVLILGGNSLLFCTSTRLNLVNVGSHRVIFRHGGWWRACWVDVGRLATRKKDLGGLNLGKLRIQEALEVRALYGERLSSLQLIAEVRFRGNGRGGRSRRRGL